MNCLLNSVKFRQFHYQIKLYSPQYIIDCNVKITTLSKKGEIEAARQVFDEMSNRDIVTWNALLTGYWQNGLFNQSKTLFDSMPDKNVVSWNSMIAGCIENGMVDEGFKYFDMMPRRNVASWNVMLSGFVKYGRVEEAIRVFRKMPYRNVVSCTAMIDGYFQKGMVREARGLFDRVEQKNSVTWTVMISGYVENGMFSEARELFEQMPDKTVVATTAMITGYCKEGRMEDARGLFNQIWQKDYVAWNALITGYSQNGNGEETLKLFAEMLNLGIQPDKATFISVLTACSFRTLLKEGRQAHSLVIKHGLGSNTSVCNTLLSMYGKCGGVVDLLLAFAEILRPDVVSWNTIISGLAQHGFYEKAFKIFNEMRANGFIPDAITFLSMLSACSHTGNVNDSMTLFDLMVKEYRISPKSEHYCCLIDILCRKGQVDKAYKIIKDMPFEGDSSTWGTLLAACHTSLNVELGELAAKKLLDLEPHNPGAYVMLSNIYAGRGMWEEVKNLRRSMKDAGVKKMIAYSWMEIGDKVHIFKGGGLSHPDVMKIYIELKRINLHMKPHYDDLDSISELICFG